MTKNIKSTLDTVRFTIPRDQRPVDWSAIHPKKNANRIERTGISFNPVGDIIHTIGGRLPARSCTDLLVITTF
jgi:hypothetical protein